MAPVSFNFTLPATVLFTVVIPGLQDLNTADPSSIVTELPPQRQLAALPDGYIAHPDIGAAYKVYKENVSWTAARRLCISKGAHLADIDTPVKLEYVLAQSSISEWAWTGIHKVDNNTEWVSSSTGLTLTTLPWAVDEPNGDYYCTLTEKVKRGLRNIRCNFEGPYVCELPIPENYNAQEIEETTELGTDHY